MPTLEWLEVARADLLGIVDYISDDSPDAAQRLKDEIETKVEKLLEFPKIYRPGRVDGTREMVVRSNYIVVYRESVSTVPARPRAAQACRHRGRPRRAQRYTRSKMPAAPMPVPTHMVTMP
ncbi:MAG: type II toxin-antitoxin system RelE/ParE family toxin [Candidimonas sp.]|nr:MAG: type II toxin-antitoxin system RelE/ParE family toxin [Candidimonas sp.]